MRHAAANRADRHVKHLAGRHTKPPLLPRRELGLAALIVSVIVAVVLAAVAVVLFAALWVFEETRAGRFWPLAVILTVALVAGVRFVIRRS